MKSFFKISIPLLTALLMALPAMSAFASECPAVLNFKAESLAGMPEDLCQYNGKVILVVNTASECGYTGQYKDLQALYEKYRDKGFIILGFPSNDFGGQEPGSSEEIKNFCERNYGVTFPMFRKSSVKTDGDNPFFKKLAETSGSPPKWNFHKYLIHSQSGEIRAFPSSTAPLETELVTAIEKFLSQP